MATLSDLSRPGQLASSAFHGPHLIDTYTDVF